MAGIVRRVEIRICDTSHVDTGRRQNCLANSANQPLVECPLYDSPRTHHRAMPYKDRTFEIDFDFIDHQLLIKCNDGAKEAIALSPTFCG